MNKVVDISVVREARSLTEQEAWAAYLAARNKAEKSGLIEDGIAAGKAWRAWCERFARIA